MRLMVIKDDGDYYDDDDNDDNDDDDNDDDDNDDSYDVESKEHMGCWSVCQTLLSHAHNSTFKSRKGSKRRR